MNIYAPRGSKIKVTQHSAKNGREHDQQLVQAYLEIDGIYTVEYTDVGGWHTDVYVQEVPGIAFNSVNFEDTIAVQVIEKDAIDTAIDKVNAKYSSVLSRLSKS